MRFCEYDNCKYPVFSTDKLTKKGYCRNHQTKRTDLDRRTILQRAMAKQKGLESKIRALGSDLSHADKKRMNDLDLWFKAVRKEIIANQRCWECNSLIPEKYFRHASAHIFPKSIFFSVSTHPLNFLVLCASGGCHNTFDSSVEKASKMKVWGEACRRFEKFEEHITENHKYYDLFKHYFIK